MEVGVVRRDRGRGSEGAVVDHVHALSCGARDCGGWACADIGLVDAPHGGGAEDGRCRGGGPVAVPAFRGDSRGARGIELFLPPDGVGSLPRVRRPHDRGDGTFRAPLGVRTRRLTGRTRPDRALIPDLDASHFLEADDTLRLGGGDEGENEREDEDEERIEHETLLAENSAERHSWFSRFQRLPQNLRQSIGTLENIFQNLFYVIKQSRNFWCIFVVHAVFGKMFMIKHSITDTRHRFHFLHG